MIKTAKLIIASIGLLILSSCGSGSFTAGNKSSQQSGQAVGPVPSVVPDSAPASGNSPGTGGVIESINVIDVAPADILGKCEESAKSLNPETIINRNNDVQNLNFISNSSLLINGNNNNISATIAASAPIDTFCSWINGNEDSLLVTVASSVDEIYLGVNGNQGSVTLQILPEVRIRTIYRFVNGGSEFNIVKAQL